MNTRQIETIRTLINEGRTDAEIAAIVRDEEYATECETRDADRFERDAYGIDEEDYRTSAQKETCDRLDMGRNDAGEWLGFM